MCDTLSTGRPIPAPASTLLFKIRALYSARLLELITAEGFQQGHSSETEETYGLCPNEAIYK
jgi:hypothetical protein